jgi:hypothetical protein
MRAAEAGEIARADALLADVRDLHGRTLAILDRAEDEADARVALGAIREARACVELLGRLAGELTNTTTVNVTLNAQWTEIRSLVVESLDAFPDARLAVAAALANVEVVP